MHEDLVERFRHEPDRRTVIELMPDHEFFAVRITGMPAIHTIAACTGPLIAIEVPKVGAPRKHLGIFDWLRVLRHEYARTITLSQTRNRIPHWLTEAAAVSIEGVPRTYETCGNSHRDGGWGISSISTRSTSRSSDPSDRATGRWPTPRARGWWSS